MREIGKIKWFGGQNKNGKWLNYGFIEQRPHSDLYVNKNKVIGKKRNLDEGDYVSFEVSQVNDNSFQAVDVKLLEEEDDYSLIKTCAESVNEDIYSKVLEKYLSSLNYEDSIAVIKKKFFEIEDKYEKIRFVRLIPKDFHPLDFVRPYLDFDELISVIIKLNGASYRFSNEYLIELIEKLKSIGNCYSFDNYFNNLPIEYLIENKELREYLSKEKHIEIIQNYLQSIDDKEIKYGNFIDEIFSILNGINESRIWMMLDYRFLRTEKLWRTAPDIIKIKYLSSYISDKENSNDGIIEILEIFKNHKEDTQELLNELPEYLKNDDRFYEFYSPINQVSLKWDRLICVDGPVWHKLKRESKLMAIYRSMKDDIDISKYADYETDDLIKILLEISSKKSNQSNKNELFVKFNRLFISHIAGIVWDLNISLNFKKWFPGCIDGEVDYCEGRLWPTEKDKKNNEISRIYCPRKRGECYFGVARIMPDFSLEWQEWSLIEFFANNKLSSTLIQNEMHEYEYVNKLSGWINRLNEIRIRLRCSKCGETLKPDLRYARNLAVYNCTVFCCSEDKNHESVYLNHCWACRSIIDAPRESKIKVENYYLCLCCGSGPKNSMNYRQGNICPKCGSMDMEKNPRYHRNFNCKKCGHSIIIPSELRLTGSQNT